jgi:mannose-6-phosphate isomerase-like protein (cupin superfamily)
MAKEHTMEKINLAQKLSLFKDLWSPRVVGELNGQYVKLAKLQGEFVWHDHRAEDELFLVLEGRMIMRLEERELVLTKGELCIVPRGVRHCPVAETEVHILLFEPKETLHMGGVDSDLAQAEPIWI